MCKVRVIRSSFLSTLSSMFHVWMTTLNWTLCRGFARYVSPPRKFVCAAIRGRTGHHGIRHGCVLRRGRADCLLPWWWLGCPLRYPWLGSGHRRRLVTPWPRGASGWCSPHRLHFDAPGCHLCCRRLVVVISRTWCSLFAANVTSSKFMVAGYYSFFWISVVINTVHFGALSKEFNPIESKPKSEVPPIHPCTTPWYNPNLYVVLVMHWQKGSVPTNYQYHIIKDLVKHCNKKDITDNSFFDLLILLQKDCLEKYHLLLHNNNEGWINPYLH